MRITGDWRDPHFFRSKDIQGRNRSRPVSGVPAELISTLSVEPIAREQPAQIEFVIQTRVPKLQPPPPRLPADQALALDLLKLYREAAAKASAIRSSGTVFNTFYLLLSVQLMNITLFEKCGKNKDGLLC